MTKKNQTTTLKIGSTMLTDFYISLTLTPCTIIDHTYSTNHILYTYSANHILYTQLFQHCSRRTVSKTKRRRTIQYNTIFHYSSRRDSNRIRLQARRSQEVVKNPQETPKFIKCKIQNLYVLLCSIRINCK